MCGRYVSATPPDQIASYFGAEAPEALLAPSYNVAPTSDVYAVLSDGSTRHVDAFHWGLVPLWAKDAKIGSRMINARAETLAEKNAYKSAFKRRRCLIPADGFYEWQKNAADPKKGKKQPFFIHRPDGEPFAFAGLWEVWRGPDKDQEPLAVLHDHHHHAQHRDGPHPRPDAGHPAALGLGHVAGPRHRRPRPAREAPRAG